MCFKKPVESETLSTVRNQKHVKNIRLVADSTYLEDYGIFTSTPSIIGKDGIEKSNTLDLENSEKLKLENSIQVIKTAIGNL